MSVGKDDNTQEEASFSFHSWRGQEQHSEATRHSSGPDCVSISENESISTDRMIGTKTSRAAPALFAAIALVAIAAASASSAAFAAPPALAGRAGLAVTSKSSAFSGVSQSGADVVISGAQQRRSGAGITGLQMGKVSAVGPFTPAVVALRAVVGEKKFNQIRGKVRSPADTRA